MTHDGLGKYLDQVITKAEGDTVDIAEVLKATRTDVVVNYLPVGSEQATKWYVEQVLQAGCAFVNCMPVFIASAGHWPERFEKRGLPLIGDDIKSQVGATITHRVLTRLFRERGVKLTKTYQLNLVATPTFTTCSEANAWNPKNLQNASRHLSTRLQTWAKTISTLVPAITFPWLEDRKWCHIRMEGETFGGVPLNLELKLEVWDSPNSAGRGHRRSQALQTRPQSRHQRPFDGTIVLPDESPPKQFSDDQAREMTSDFIRQYGLKE